MKDSLSSPLRVDLESVLIKLSSLAFVDILVDHSLLLVQAWYTGNQMPILHCYVCV